MSDLRRSQRQCISRARRHSFEQLEPRHVLSSSGLFDCVEPLAAPADGNVALFIDDFGVDGGPADNTFIARATGVTLTAGSTYTITAATGRAVGASLGDQSIQAYSTPDGAIANRQFIAQQFSDSGTWNSAADGQWVDNSLTFAANGVPAQIGQELILLVTNYVGGDAGIVYWDNFRVLEDGNLVFSDSVETGLSPGSEGEVDDAGWDLGNSTLANSGLIAPSSSVPPTNALGVTVTGNRVEITNPSQRLSFVQDGQGDYRLTTYVWDGADWQALFDGAQPLLTGPTFNFHPDTFNILTNTATDVAVEFRGTHPTLNYELSTVVEAASDSDLMHFVINADLTSPLTITGPEPHAMLWMNQATVDLQMDQGQGNIFAGNSQWGNSFPAAYLWDQGVEAAVFFDMEATRWMGPSNLRRFHEVRVQTVSSGGMTGFGLRALTNTGTTIPAGDMGLEFYLHAAPRAVEPSKLEGLDTLVDVFTPLHPSTAPFPTNRIAPFTTDWTTFAEGTDANLQLQGIVWDDFFGQQFLAQNFRGNAGWSNASPGNWIDNSVSFSANSFPNQIGEELIILVTNFGGGNGGIVYWDNFRVLENGIEVFSDSLETGLTLGGAAEVTDAGWQLGNSTFANSGILAPSAGSGLFNATGPLAAPADGNTVLFIDDFGVNGGPSDNTFVARATGITIEAGKTYTIRAATGRSLTHPLGDQSIQAYATVAVEDGPLFTENKITSIPVSSDSAVDSSQNPAFNRETVLEAWDFSTVNNYLAPWVAFDRLNPDGARHEFVLEKANALPAFFDDAAGLIRHGVADLAHVGPFEMSWQSFMFHLETLKTSRLLAPEDFNPAIAGKFLMALDGLKEFGQNVNYLFPQWFDPISKVGIIQQDFPQLGIVYEPWQIGTYAYLMIQGFELTGDGTYLAEAQASLDALFTQIQFSVTNSVYSIDYDDAADFPITEIFGNSWGTAAAQTLLELTGDAKYQDYADHFFNSLARMTYWYESRLSTDVKDLVLATAGLFRNHGGAFTGSPWENSEAILPLTVLLKSDAEPHQLALKLFNLQRVNSFHFYPNAQPGLVLPYPDFQSHPANYLPIEDYFTFEHGGLNGDLGRRIYMSGAALWNYLLFEAYGVSSDRDVMVLNLDAVEDSEKAIQGVKRSLLVYNPTEITKNFDLPMNHLMIGNYQVIIEDSSGGITEQLLTSTALTSGTSMSLAPGDYLRIRLQHENAQVLAALIDAGESARNRIAYAYQLLQDEATDQGVTPTLSQLKQTYLDALSDYDSLLYAAAEQKANQVVFQLVVHNADFDIDDDVDGIDFLAWQRGFGTLQGATHAEGDANLDGTVNDLDLLFWEGSFTNPPAANSESQTISQDAIDEAHSTWTGLEGLPQSLRSVAASGGNTTATDESGWFQGSDATGDSTNHKTPARDSQPVLGRRATAPYDTVLASRNISRHGDDPNFDSELQEKWQGVGE
ncbi:hypothetical protein OAS39_01665 [Pirellulales bacterium]|nr:hypothetical protein [Pirellulales bacterium]